MAAAAGAVVLGDRSLGDFPVVGPQSRAVIGSVFADVDVSQRGVPVHGGARDTLGGVPVRLARVSFSGELAYEVNVNWWHAPAVWERLIAAGDRYGITPYGTETMHVLRAEKGYPIIGQDTDGTVTPHDLGMAWAVSKKKPDFIGKRSFSRVENQNPLRKQLVGLLPVDRVPGCRRVRRSSSSAPTTRYRRHRFRCSGMSPRAIAAPSWAARSRSRWSGQVSRASARPCMCPSRGR